MTTRQAEIIELIKKEVKPALGCTEPIAVALAVAKAMEIMEEHTQCPADWRYSNEYRLKIDVSGNILKNGMGVGIPGTGMVGLHIASALGAVCGKSSYGLEVLNDLDEESIAKAKEMVEKQRVCVGIAETPLKLYVKATVICGEVEAYAVIENDHDNIAETGLGEKVLTSSRKEEACSDQKTTLDYKLTVKEIFEFATSVAYEDISFILESRTLNLALAEEGLKGTYGLMVGQAISAAANREVPGKSGHHAHGEGELVITLESWEVTRASRRVEEGLSRSFSDGGGKPSFPSHPVFEELTILHIAMAYLNITIFILYVRK